MNFYILVLPLDGAEAQKIELHRLDHIKLYGYIDFYPNIIMCSIFSKLDSSGIPKYELKSPAKIRYFLNLLTIS